MPNVITHVEQQLKGRAHATIVRDGPRSVPAFRVKDKVRHPVSIPVTAQHAAVAFVTYKDEFYSVVVPVKPGESETIALELAFREIVKKARAARLTDFCSGERIA